MNRSKKEPMSEINVTPFVDVMLVLLIIFMVTAPLLTVGVQVDLPESAADSLPEDQEPLNHPTYHYSVGTPEDPNQITTDGGTPGYGYFYDFSTAYVNGVILPPSPFNPGVFELKNPNINIKGRVR